MEERLQKILAEAGIASRRRAEKLILEGRVSVDGEVISELGRKYEASAHVICVDDRQIRAAEPHVYFLLNKPKGYVSTAHDERGRKTVLDLLPEVKERIYPVGRLDADTEGLLLLTNDGALMNGLLHPRFEVQKVYIARVSPAPTQEALERLREGIRLEDGPTAPAKLQRLSEEGASARIEIAIHEGRNRQVRRMFAAVGCEVRGLKRVAFAGLTLKGVRRGRHRALTAEELAALRRTAGLSERKG